MELTFDAKKKQKTKPLHTQQKQNKKIEKETKEAKKEKRKKKNGANAINNSFARDFVKSVHNWIILLTTKIVLA